MGIIAWGLRFLVPFVVLYSIGYYVPGFSALTIPWLLMLSVLIVIGDLLSRRLIGESSNQLGIGLIAFLVATVVIFLSTLAIPNGSVPLGASLLAAGIIAIFNSMINSWYIPRKISEERG